MYYPKQMLNLLNPEFTLNIEYLEHAPKELEEYCMCIWEMKSKSVLNKTILNNILPDACIDIIIDFESGEIFFAGFSKETESFPLNKHFHYMGVRLKPGIFYSLFHIGADQVMDHTISFSEIEKEYNLSVVSSNDSEKQLNLLKEYLLKKIEKAPNKNFAELANKLYRHPSEQSIIDLASHMGYGKRHLFRIFKTNYGLSPKVVLNILRLHLCLTMLLEEKKHLIDVATLCGFYDQSHFIKEIKRYTGFSPISLLEKYR